MDKSQCNNNYNYEKGWLPIRLGLLHDAFRTPSGRLLDANKRRGGGGGGGGHCLSCWPVCQRRRNFQLVFGTPGGGAYMLHIYLYNPVFNQTPTPSLVR